MLGALCGVLTGCCLRAVSASTAAHADAAALPPNFPWEQDWSWNKPAHDYIQLYYSAME